MPPEVWTARVSRSVSKWHRVERVGAHVTQDPIALVREPAHAVAFAALPDLAEALAGFRMSHESECRCDRCTVADAALAKMEGK